MKVHFINADDYVTMFIDGKNALDGHSLDVREVAKLLIGDENVTSEWVDEAGDEGEAYMDRVDEFERNNTER